MPLTESDLALRFFPVMGVPDLDVPWRLVERHAKQAEKNHDGQSVRTLACRGGLDPCELIDVLCGYRVGHIGGHLQEARLSRREPDAVGRQGHRPGLARDRNRADREVEARVHGRADPVRLAAVRGAHPGCPGGLRPPDRVDLPPRIAVAVDHIQRARPRWSAPGRNRAPAGYLRRALLPRPGKRGRLVAPTSPRLQ